MAIGTLRTPRLSYAAPEIWSDPPLLKADTNRPDGGVVSGPVSGTSPGQVPQTGRGSVQAKVSSAKPLGSTAMRRTHQSVRSWLNRRALQNAPFMVTTLETSQRSRGWLNGLSAKV